MSGDQDQPAGFVFRFQRAIREAQLSAHAKLIALVLATYADVGGRSVFPSQRRIAQDSGLALSTTTKRLAELSAGGWVKSFDRARNGRGWRRSGYVLSIPSAAVTASEAGNHPATAAAPKRSQVGAGVYRDTAHDARGVPSHGIGVYRHAVLTSSMTRPERDTPAPAPAREGGLGYPAIVQALIARGTSSGQCTSDRGQRVIAGWVGLGVTEAVLSQAMDRAARAKPKGSVPPAYLDPIVRELIEQRSGASHENGRGGRENSVDVLWRNAAATQ